jgi:hypothetical protein
MKNRKKIIIGSISLALVIVLAILIYHSKQESAQQQTLEAVSGNLATSTQNQTTISEENAKLYVAGLKKPYFQELRNIFDKYLNGQKISEAEISAPELVIETSNDGQICGFKSFDKDYFKSKFILSGIEEGQFGGIYIDILFLNKPDKMFTAWFYETPEGWDLRSFCENANATPEEINASLKYLGDYLLKPGFSI